MRCDHECDRTEWLLQLQLPGPAKPRQPTGKLACLPAWECTARPRAISPAPVQLCLLPPRGPCPVEAVQRRCAAAVEAAAGERTAAAGPTSAPPLAPRPPRRLLLTSSGLTRAPFQQALAALLAARRPGGRAKVLYIPDAAVGNGCDLAAAHGAVARQLMALGAAAVLCLELRGTSPEVLAQHLDGVDCLYVEMGNTYYLRFYMHTSGFDRLVPPMVREAGVVYAGASAGSMTAGRTISVAFWKGWDNPGYGQEWDLQHLGYHGLDLLPGGSSVFPHYGASWRALVEARRAELDHEVLLLDEDHAYLVDGEREELVPPALPPARASAGCTAPSLVAAAVAVAAAPALPARSPAACTG